MSFETQLATKEKKHVKYYFYQYFGLFVIAELIFNILRFKMQIVYLLSYQKNKSI